MNEFMRIISLVIAIVSFIFGIVVYFKNKKQLTNIIFSLLSLSIGGWAFSRFMQFSSTGIEQAQVWAMVCNLFACFAPVLFLHFCMRITDRFKYHVIFLRISYLAAFAFFFIAIFAS